MGRLLLSLESLFLQEFLGNQDMVKGCSFEDVIQFPKQTILKEMENRNVHLPFFNYLSDVTLPFVRYWILYVNIFQLNNLKEDFFRELKAYV